jgi:dethiobiotin synthetase
VTARIYAVGTDTGAGKTTVLCALLGAARRAGVRAIPFKPAESGGTSPDDVTRLLAAAGLPAAERDAANPLRYEAVLAPGIAADRERFLKPDLDEPDSAPLASVQWGLAVYSQRHDPALVLIEAAGGLHVPMPGGTWQEDWIATLARHTIVIARAGLGTINHTLLTIDALRERGCPPIGFFLSQSRSHADPSRADNTAVIEQRAELPCLGQLPYLGRPAQLPARDDWLAPDVWARLLAAR